MASTTDSPAEHKTVIPVPPHHSVPIITIGIVAPNENEDGDSDDGLLYTHAERMEDCVTRTAPDRLNVIVLDPSSHVSWPLSLHVLILCVSRPGYSSKTVTEYLQASNTTSTTPIILTDFDIEDITHDRRIFYDLLESYHHDNVSELLPVRAYANRDEYNKEHYYHRGDDVSPAVMEHRELIEVNGSILFKPCVERPVDAANDDVRVYYPASAGGGCKHLKTGRYFPDENTVRANNDNDMSSYIYEETGVGDDELTKEVDEMSRAETLRHWRRNRLKSFAYNIAPGISNREVVPDYADDDEVTYDSDLRRKGRKFFIVTTASLPWMTGTAINPLLRAAYLKKTLPAGTEVTLVMPWLELEEDRVKLYGPTHKFEKPSDQEAHVRDWLRNEADLPEEAETLCIMWYPGRYHSIFLSIFATHDVCSLIPDDEADVCVLEEPEHQSWFRAEATPWKKKFNFVIGIVHTNYSAYVGIMGPFVSEMSTLVIRAYCHKLIKLSAVLQSFSPDKEVVANVHGVRTEFIREGERRSAAASTKNEARDTSTNRDTGSENGVYYVGKMLWAKGLDKLLRLQEYHKESTGNYFRIDIYGDGPEMDEIQRAYLGRGGVKSWLSIPKTSFEFRRTPIPATFYGRLDHAELTEKYKIFVNPSVSEVHCTTTAEALAMGKFVIIPVHLSNEFFMQFPNCLPYSNELEFAANVQWALAHEPEPLTENLLHQFTWEAATDRFIKAAAITIREERIRAKSRRNTVDERIAFFHSQLAEGKRGDIVRKMWGLGPVVTHTTVSKKEADFLQKIHEKASMIASVSGGLLLFSCFTWLILWWNGSLPNNSIRYW